MVGHHTVQVINPNRHYEGHFTLYVGIACVVAASGGLIFGYDIGISGGVTSMDSFLLKFFPAVYVSKHTARETDYCKYDSQLLQAFTSSLYLAGLIAAFFASYTTRTWGRKKTMLVGGLAFFLGAFLNGAAQNLAMLIIGRILLGTGVGFGNQAVPLYLSEMAPANWRGALNILFQLATTAGILVANVINYFTSTHAFGWRISLGLAIVPAICLISGGLFCPETPNSLIERGQVEEGRRILQKIRGTMNVEAEYDDMVEASGISKKVHHPLRNIIKMKHRPQLLMAILIPMFQQLTGINAVMFYAPVLFSTIGFGANASLFSAIITGVVNVLATFVSIASVDRVGRRTLFLEGGIQMIICQVIVGVILGLKFGGTNVLSKRDTSAVVSFVCVFVAGFAWSWGPLGWLVPSEIFPMEIRSAGQGLVVSVNLLFTFLIAQLFLTILCHFQYGIFLFFAGWEVIMTLFIFFFLPETKNVPIEEIVLLWQKHWFWKRFILNDNKDMQDFDGK